MKSFLRFVLKLFLFLVIAAFLISCFTQYIPPSAFSFITLFCLGFPYLFLLMFILALFFLFMNKRIALLLFICLLFGYKNFRSTAALNFFSAWSTEKNDSALRIMTWNVQDFINLLPQSEVRLSMQQLIKQYNPDILCVQEFTNVEEGKWKVSMRKELALLGYNYYIFSDDQLSTSIYDKNVMRGSALFSKQAFTDSGRFNIHNPVINENAVYAGFVLGNKPLRIYTTHLASFAFYKDTVPASGDDIYKLTYERKRAIEYKLRETEQIHEQQAAILRNALLKSPYPVIYCGDMNTTSCSYNYRILKGDLQDAFLEKGSGIGSTFYKILPTLRIDVCLADRALKINQCTVITRKLSDHYPIVTDISWK